MNFFKRFYWIPLTIFFVTADQISKFLVNQFIAVGDSIVLIPDFFSLSHVRNTGAAFGMLSEQRWVFMVFTAIVIIAAIGLMLSGKVKNHWGIIAVSLILGGGIGNMIDRLLLGEVVDFFAFNFWGYQFAVFNVADIFVCCGTVILALYVIFGHDFDSPKKKEVENGDA